MRPVAASADALLVVAAGVLLLFAVRAGGDSTPPAALPLTVADRVSGWRAPGVGVPLTGFAAAHEPVVLRANGRAVAGTTGGRAPGVGVPLPGFAAAQEPVVLRANGRAVAGTTSGRLGRYRLRFAALT